MSELIGIVGASGSGKTTSIRNLNPEETFIISTTGKRPGIKGAKKKYPDFTIDKDTKKISGNFYTSSSVDKIRTVMQVVNQKMPQIKTLVIDDFQYLQAFESMNRVDEKGYGKFTDIAKHAYEILKDSMNMRDNLFVVVLTHSENAGTAEEPYEKIKTIGKMLDSVITLEGLFTYVLFTKVVKDANDQPQYKFVTNSDGSCTAKTPMGMFNERLIDNDLKLVIDTINEYNNEE